jgi:hypothetical protein
MYHKRKKFVFNEVRSVYLHVFPFTTPSQSAFQYFSVKENKKSVHILGKGIEFRSYLCSKTFIAILSRYYLVYEERKLLLGFGINLRNIGKKVKNTTGVTPLVVVPGNQLDKVVVERDTGLGVEDG